jgi:hypothetical protein
MEINIHFGLINKSACAHAHSHYFPKWVLLFYCLYPQKTELVSTAKLPLGNGWIVHLRESDKGTICSRIVILLLSLLYI